MTRHWVVALGACIAGWSGLTFAAASVSDALRDIKAAPTFCRRQDAPALANAGSTGAKLARISTALESSCAMAASSAAELAKRPGTVVVDTRPTAEFNRFHIDGAISLQADAIRTKSFLMKHPLVLVGSGKGEQELYSQCAQLRTNGNPATHVLQGGMAAWVLSELPMVGTAPAASEMVTLSPAELFAEVSGGSSRYFVLPGAAKIKDQIPAATVLGSGRLETGLVAIKNTPAAQGAGSRSIVVIADGTVTQAQIASAAALLRPRPVLFYLDGASSYSKFVSAQKAVWVAHAHGPKVPPCSLR